MPEIAARRDDRRRAVDERQRGEDAEAEEVGDDHQPPSREPVDERPEQEPDEDDRQEVGDEERGDPDARLGAVVDVDRERDRREVGAEAGPRGGEEEVAERRRAAEEAETAGALHDRW